MHIRLKPLEQQVMVITGASSGIGLAAARKAARAGVKVMLVARNEPVLRETVEAIHADGGEAAYIVADVGDLAQVQAAAAAAVGTFGRIDTWVNNAGVAIYADLLATPRDEHERLFRTNYWGVVNGAQTAVPHLKATGGALITVGSLASDIGTPVMGAYSASKHAVKGYLDSLRIELNRDKADVSVSLIKPAGIGTPLSEHIANHEPGAPKIPPPVSGPGRVVDAILRAAVTPVREHTVGFVGELQILAATHFPGTFAKLAGAMTPLLLDPRKADPSRSNLFRAGRDGETLNPDTARHRRMIPVAAGITLGAGLAIAAIVGAARRRGESGADWR